MAEAAPMTCQELVKLVSDYLDGMLPSAEAERFENHLRTCEGCTRYLDQMRKTIRIAGALSEESLDPAATAELLRVFRDWSRT